METTLSIEKKVALVKDSKKGTYGFAAFSLLVVIVLLFGAIRPTAVTIFRIIEEVKQKEELLSQLQAKSQLLKNLDKDYQNNVKDDLKSLSLIFPSRGDFSLFMANIEQVCKNNNYELQSIGFDKPDKSIKDSTALGLKKLQTWAVNISIKGDKSNIIKLLKDIEAMPNYPVVEQISFSNIPDDSGKMNFSILVRIYTIDDPDFYSM